MPLVSRAPRQHPRTAITKSSATTSTPTSTPNVQPTVPKVPSKKTRDLERAVQSNPTLQNARTLYNRCADNDKQLKKNVQNTEKGMNTFLSSLSVQQLQALKQLEQADDEGDGQQEEEDRQEETTGRRCGRRRATEAATTLC